MWRSFGLVALFWLSQITSAQAVTIWPLMPQISSGDRATAIYLENTSQEIKQFQVRVRSWLIEGGNDVMSAQDKILASPSMLEVEPGQRQLVRLVYLAQARVPSYELEQSYRVIVDDITEREVNETHINMRMRYVLPLFVGAHAALPPVAENDVQMHIEVNGQGSNLVVRNSAARHLRLSSFTLLGDGEPLIEHEGLLGYVLPQSTNTFTLPEHVVQRLQQHTDIMVEAKHGRKVLTLPAEVTSASSD